MDLQDKALLLNPDSVQALLDGITQQHTTHAIGRMQDCDRAVCRLADQVGHEGDFLSDQESRDEGYDDGHNAGHHYGYDEGYDDGYADHAAEVKRNAALS